MESLQTCENGLERPRAFFFLISVRLVQSWQLSRLCGARPGCKTQCGRVLWPNHASQNINPLFQTKRIRRKKISEAHLLRYHLLFDRKLDHRVQSLSVRVNTKRKWVTNNPADAKNSFIGR